MTKDIAKEIQINEMDEKAIDDIAYIFVLIAKSMATKINYKNNENVYEKTSRN